MIRSLLLGLATATIAANLYSKSRRRTQGPQGAGTRAQGRRFNPTQRSDSGRQQEFAGSPTAFDDLDRMRADSPNTGERLQATNLTGSPIGEGTPLAEQHESGELFGSSSQQGPKPVTTGLPDFSRGA